MRSGSKIVNYSRLFSKNVVKYVISISDEALENEVNSEESVSLRSEEVGKIGIEENVKEEVKEEEVKEDEEVKNELCKKSSK